MAIKVTNNKSKILPVYCLLSLELRLFCLFVFIVSSESGMWHDLLFYPVLKLSWIYSVVVGWWAVKGLTSKILCILDTVSVLRYASSFCLPVP